MRAGALPLLAALATFLLSPAAHAQAGAPSGCILDNCRDRAPAAPARAAPPATNDNDPNAGASRPSVFRRGPTAASGNFDFYVLSLSWSSGFCAGGGDQKSPDQCAVGSHQTFVVHGLWPQFEHGFPADCDPSARPPTRAAMDLTHGVYPDEGLARYEWRKHGTCTGKSATDYFSDVKFARDQVKVPPEFEKLQDDEQVAPLDIARAFQSANPRLRPGMMAIGCQRGVLQEVRICFSKDLRDFRPCPEVARGSCRSRQISVPAPR
jgi:ribonuclease T2